ncbi:hypothetical protein FFF34_017350 [Inquilinus sp. KBS0705]|nr:hypothetical protein FFF34_017350 [Inquilinus sp. KBS0705]
MITKFTKRTVLLFASGVLLLAACKKDDQSEITATPVDEQDTITQNGLMLAATTHMLTRMDQDAKNYTAFAYSNGLITKVDEKEDGELTTTTFTYDAKKILKSALTKGGGMNYIYTGGLLTRVDIVTNPGNKVVSYMKFAYQNNKISEITMYVKYGTADVAFLKLAYTYTGSDVTTNKSYIYSFVTHKFSLTETTQTVYDTKKSPISSTPQLSQAFFQAFSIHNPVKETTTDEKNKVTEINTYTYTYDSAGYPLIQTKKNAQPGLPPVTTKIKYAYK